MLPDPNGVDVLGWDFAFELNEVARQQAALANIHDAIHAHPARSDQEAGPSAGDVRFFELAALQVDVAQQGRAVTLTIADFCIPLDDVPEDVQRAITNWAQWIDYWAVDWDDHGDTFRDKWQTYRTRQSRSWPCPRAHDVRRARAVHASRSRSSTFWGMTRPRSSGRR